MNSLLSVQYSSLHTDKVEMASIQTHWLNEPWFWWPYALLAFWFNCGNFIVGFKAVKCSLKAFSCLLLPFFSFLFFFLLIVEKKYYVKDKHLGYRFLLFYYCFDYKVTLKTFSFSWLFKEASRKHDISDVDIGIIEWKIPFARSLLQ